MTGGHGLTRPLGANKQPLRTCLTGFWMRFHSDKGTSILRHRCGLTATWLLMLLI